MTSSFAAPRTTRIRVSAALFRRPWLRATLLLSVGLHNYTHFGVIPTAIGIGLGFMAIWLGVALARTG